MEPRRRPLFVACVVSSVLLAPLSTASGTAGAQPLTAAPSCSGLPATIVGSPEMRRLRGTAENDVIVTGGARNVEALAGDDTICISGRSEFVSSGEGDDTVTSDDRDFETYVSLDEGADTFVGGARRDRVSPGAGADQVATGAGSDSYDSFAWPGGAPSDDPMVELGAGNDRAAVDFSNVTGVLDGGPGFNTLTMVCCGEELDWIVSNVTETATVGGEQRFQWDRFRGFGFGPYGLTGTVEFEGTDAAERVVVGEEFGIAPAIARLDMRGGNDEVVYSGTLGPVHAGDGQDWVRVVGFADERSLAWAGRVSIDLRRDRLRADGRSARIWDVENVDVSEFVKAVLRGDGQDNHLVVSDVCRAELYGGAGDDVLRGRPHSRHCATYVEGIRTVEASGGRGDDTLGGRWTADRLVGGRGVDRADGRKSVDLCRAEVRRRCES